MRVKVLFFAQLRDIFGEASRTIEVGGGATVSDVVRKLDEVKRLANLPLFFAVNQEFARPDDRLKDDDELALLPPVAGG